MRPRFVVLSGQSCMELPAMLSKLEKKTVLIVEDEHLIACDLKSDLEEKGLVVSAIAHSGLEALDYLKNHRPGCIVLDIHLNGNLDGIEVAHRIRSLYSIPLIYLSGYADDNSLERAIETGACGYLVKPVNCRQLFATVLLALHQKSYQTGFYSSEYSTHSLEPSFEISRVL